MPRPTIAIDIIGAQRILDGIKPDQFTNESSLCTFAAEQYNKTIGTPTVNNQLIKLRINSGVLRLPFAMPKGKRGRQSGTPLTVEHKEKLLSGRANSKKKFSINADNKRAASELKARWGDKYPKLVDAAIKGNKSACIKLHCIQCMGDDAKVRDSIKNCTSFTCAMYQIRPFQKNNAEGI